MESRASSGGTRGVLLQQQEVAGVAHVLREDGRGQRQLVGQAALTEHPAAVLALLLEGAEATRARSNQLVFYRAL